MFKVLLQSFIVVCLFCAILLYMQENANIMTSLYMEISQTTTKEDKRVEQDEGNPTDINEITDTGGLKTERSSLSRKDFSLDLCLVFVYYLAAKRATIETAFIAATTLFFHEVSAFPVNSSTTQNAPNLTENNYQDMIKNGRTKRRTKRMITEKNSFNQGDCDSQWFERHSKCYRMFDQKQNYLSAKEYCRTVQSQLVTVQGKEEDEFVYQLSNESGYLWINVYNASGNNNNWSPGHFRKNGDCVVLVNAGQWRNFDCGYKFAFVCEKDVTKPEYSQETLLIALLVPIFSCITVAVALTTALLVSSVRRGDQPFKISSRYALKKTRRRIATWEMIDTLRRASLKRRSSRQKSGREPRRESVPSIEVTTPTGEKRPNGIDSEKVRRKGRLKKQDSGSKPPESPNSSLYELLVRLNSMTFIHPRYNEGIELQEMREYSSEDEDPIAVTIIDEKFNNAAHVAKNGNVVQESTGDLVTNEEHCDSKSFHEKPGNSFRNMAFRDSMASIETNSSGVSKKTSVCEKCRPENDIEETPDINTDSIEPSPQCPSGDDVDVPKREGMGPSKKTTTVKVDVHKISIAEEPSEGLEPSDNQRLERTKVVWTYDI